MTDSSAYLSAAIWRAMDWLRGQTTADESMVFVLSLLLHRMRHPANANRDQPSAWENVDERPVAKATRIVDEVERELNIQIPRPALDSATAHHLLDLVNGTVQAAQSDDEKKLQFDHLFSNINEQMGQFNTPRSVAAAMVDLLDLQPNRSIFDPASGSGEMLSASLDFFGEKRVQRGAGGIRDGEEP